MSENILEMRNITKIFPGVKALDNVSFEVGNGNIHALVGENGAGKSTLMNVLSGIHPHGTYEGEIYFEGRECRFKNIKDSEELGIAFIHQELALNPFMTVAENIFLGNERQKNGIIDWETTAEEAKKLMKMVGLNIHHDALIKDIMVGQQQLVEIAKALGKNCKLLILDEPTAALNDRDSQNLLNLLVELNRTRGLSCIIISHKLHELTQICNRLTVLRDGQTITTMEKGDAEISEDNIIRHMVGRKLTNRFPERTPNIGEVAFEVQDWKVYDPLDDTKVVIDNVSFKLRKGEIVGFSGLMGAGRTELAMSIFGKMYGRNIEGKVIKNGKEIVLNRVRDAIESGVAYLSENRKEDGLILISDIKENITLSNLNKLKKNGVIDLNIEIKVANEYKEALNIKASSIFQKAESLSGGNQQKVCVSKCLFTDPDVLILDEPTRGIDVGAKYEIYKIINQLADEGKCVMFISSELPEILGISDRIYVMNEGRIVDEMPAKEASQEKIMTSIVQSSSGR
ncbi:ABC transporter ATP-binding protein [Marispirochaeta aestuarii]|uniref:ABC transporter ATP-binding protein n=1 Tax=Marispirochaeta aestuarii TaxID=1963862 RepID=A0A1Y1RXH9_9SPIO|nr:sugar ABC transporter ATP-binding protein [Marispirochaeta aestuarii]ORC35043.1 ABC transporter ATP-binding protein [Marispirochaeta aestuarii]